MPPKKPAKTSSSPSKKIAPNAPRGPVKSASDAPPAMRKSARLAAKGPQERPKLPADVLSEILLLLESFDDLGRAILSNSSFHDAFRAHRRAVLKRVARNLTGPDADHAFGLLKDLAVHALVSGVGKSKEEVKQSRERMVMPADAEMSAADVREFRRIFMVVDGWETIFELLVKDPQARHRPALYYRAFPPRPTCRMTYSERTRFRRAVLRFWRYCVQSVAMIQNYDALKAVRPVVEHYSKVFGSLSPLEAAEVMAVVDVTKQLVQNVFTWNLDGDDGFMDFQSALVSSGPGALNDAWKLFTTRSCTDQRFLDKLDLICSKAGGGSREGFEYSFDHPFFEEDDDLRYELVCAIHLLDEPHAQLVTELEDKERERASRGVALVQNQAA